MDIFRNIRRIVLLISALVSLAGWAGDRYVVDVGTYLNIRDPKGNVIGSLHNGDTIEVLSKSNGKGEIRFKNSRGTLCTGYVSMAYARKVQEKQALAQKRSESSWLSKIGSWWWVLLLLYVFIKYKQGYSIAWAVLHLPDRLFYWMNQLQFFLQKPWRWLLKRPANWVISCHKNYVHVAPIFVMYVVSTPLRFVNAAYFNIFDRGIHYMFDSLNEILRPTEHGMKYKSGWDYTWRWLVGLPIRAGYYGLCLATVILEGFIFTAFDTVVPTLTLYHGTTPYAAQKITEANNWQVGQGAYAGYGIYFGAQLRTARNYAQGVIVVSRVTLGYIENLNLHRYMRTLPATRGGKGHSITQWALDNNFTTIEWWREDRGWWEYCMADHSYGYDKPWRIRPLYVIKEYTANHHRIEGCVKLWFVPQALKWALDD